MTTYQYPPSPKNPPKELTALSSSYLFRVVLAILSIVLFFVLYTALVIALAYLVYFAVIYDMGNINKLTILMKIGAIAGSAMLFIFTLKFVFKLKNHKPENRIQLSKEDYPDVWKFILEICKETNAPKPKSIYVDPDVNAYVSYTNTWLSLLLPVKKDLTIGLGLVSCVNMSEFKAIMSHEFGHFAQKSMKVGSYIMSANTIIHDMIFSRDKWDDLLDQWRASDLRLSAAAWVITPIVWIIRQVLNLFYQFLNIMYSSLSREMEFNADKVAVRATGSDAIISGLWKLDAGFESWNSMLNHAYMASQNKIYVNNLYTHNEHALDRVADTQKEQLNNLPQDDRGGKKYFSSSENSKVGMYASHPPNDKRQDSAKTPYIACEQNESSPWILFGKKAKIQEEMTALIYKQYLSKTPESFVKPVDFEQFIKDETLDKDLFEEYSNTFEHRFITIPDITELKQANLNMGSAVSFKEELKSNIRELMKPVKTLEELMLKSHNIAEGTTTEKSFTYKEKQYNRKNINEGYTQLTNDREALFENTFIEWDKMFCSFHLKLAEEKNKDGDLIKLYALHKTISNIYKSVIKVKKEIYDDLAQMQAREDVTQSQLNSFGERVNKKYTSLNAELEEFEKIDFVPLPNVNSVSDMKESIIAEAEFKKETGPIFENGGFDRILVALDQVMVHCQRLDQKSIAVILSFHKELE